MLEDLDLPLLSVNHLTVYKSIHLKEVKLLNDITFKIYKNERIGLIGQSGSGKSLTVKAILGLLPPNLHLDKNSNINLHKDESFKKTISYIPQNPQLNLNPLITCGEQIMEALNVVNDNITFKNQYNFCLDWLKKVGLMDSERIYNSFPHELSGGQLQRICIAMALCQKPALILADEPTTALDPILQNQVLNLLFSLADEIKASVLLISHDQVIISKWTNKFMVLTNGNQITEFNFNFKSQRNELIPFIGTEKLLEIKNLSMYYVKGWFKKTYFNALDNVSIQVRKGESVGVVGRSGSGKSTLAKVICGLIPFQKGIVLYNENSINSGPGNNTDLDKSKQLIFQNPYLSLNPKLTIFQSLEAAIQTIEKKLTKIEIREQIIKILTNVGLNEAFLNKYPRECSGGEQQRIAIARSLCVNPQLLILDEALASLDLERQSSIISLLHDLKMNLNIAYLFISHDLNRVSEICDYVFILENGQIVESGKTKETFQNPKSKELKKLLANL